MLAFHLGAHWRDTWVLPGRENTKLKGLTYTFLSYSWTVEMPVEQTLRYLCPQLTKFFKMVMKKLCLSYASQNLIWLFFEFFSGEKVGNECRKCKQSMKSPLQESHAFFRLRNFVVGTLYHTIRIGSVLASRARRQLGKRCHVTVALAMCFQP